uniref:Clathrin light chain n=1 Tax=Wollemia nobilis TaxID=56998 RepID=A0A0C9S2J6_9CONI
MSGYDSYVGGGDDLTGGGGSGGTTRPFDSDGYMGYDPRLASQRYDTSSFRSPDAFPDEHFPDAKDADDFDNGYDDLGAGGGGGSGSGSEANPPPPVYVNMTPTEDDASLQQPDTPPLFSQGFESSHASVDFGGGDYSPQAEAASSELNGKPFGENGLYGMPPSDGPLLPDPDEMQEEGFLLREWRRQNTIRLEEKERREKEMLHQIMDEAEAFREEFYNKRKIHCETNKSNNREKEKVFLSNQEKFHANADKQYWKAVAELIPHELPAIESKRSARDKDKKKPSIVVNQGPKPGKPTDLSRMRQILLKLKHNPPPHMKPPPPPAPAAAPAANGAAPASSTGTNPASSSGTALATVSSTGTVTVPVSSSLPAQPVSAA